MGLASSPLANAGSLTIGWDPSDDPNVAAYGVHFGQVSGHYTDSVMVSSGTSVTLSGLAGGATYYFAVTSYDIFGLESPYSEEISSFIPLPVTIVRNGIGMAIIRQDGIGPDFTQTAYTIAARPGPGMVFAGWTGSLPSSATVLSFVWISNVVLRANFMPSPYPAAQGSYNGLFAEAGQTRTASSGAFSISIARLGGYSGRLQIGATRYSFSGRLDAQCQATSLILRANDNPLSLALNVGTGDSAGEISGALTDGDWIANLSGERAVFDARTNAAPFAGGYTVAFPGVDGDPLLPAGDGAGTVRIYRGGLVVFAGRLAGGAKVTQTATMSASSLWPMYLPLYGGTGALFGWPAFKHLAGSAEIGQVTWIKPADPQAQYYATGFTNQLGVLASAYVPPTGSNGRLLPLANGSVVFSGGNLAADFTNSVTISPLGRVSNLSGGGLNLTISPSTGIFRGSTVDPASGLRFPINGVVLQNLDAGFGFLLGTNQSSRVLIAPVE